MSVARVSFVCVFLLIIVVSRYQDVMTPWNNCTQYNCTVDESTVYKVRNEGSDFSSGLHAEMGCEGCVCVRGFEDTGCWHVCWNGR